MAASINAIYPKKPNVGVAVISAANTNRVVTGITGLTLLFTAGSDGSRLDSITAIATGATTQGALRFWYYIGTGNAVMWEEDLVTAITPGAGVAPFLKELLPVNWGIPAGSFIYVSTNNAEAFSVIARGGDY
jgi:hypothetical protein